MKRLLTPLLGVVALASIGSSMAAEPTIPGLEIEKSKQTKNYIVVSNEASLLEYTGGISGIAATKPNKGEKIDFSSDSVAKYSAHLESMHEEILSSVGVGKDNIVYQYRAAFAGFAAALTPAEAAEISEMGHKVTLDTIRALQTNSSAKFLGLTEKGSAWLKGYTGEGVVVGVIDSGVNPEHPSFADVPTPKRGSKGKLVEYGPAPSSFSGTGCEFGNTEFNPEDAPFTCNNKLLKAQYFVDGFGADRLIAGEFLSARDSDGHGSHTASTAAGNYGVPAFINDEYQGDVTGIAPRARLAVYKVCWDEEGGGGCASSDSMAAIDQAIADGVDVINFSVGGPSTSFDGPDNLAFLRAADAGVFVATSQGNSGPDPETTGTPAGVPWITAVGAAQDDQVFATGVVVSEPETIIGEYIALEGGGIITLEDVGDITSEVAAAEPANACTTLTNPEAIEGKIALVIRGACGFLAKYAAAAEAGASAIVVYNDGTGSDRMDPISMGGFDGTETIPGVMVGFTSGDAMFRAISSRETVVANVGPSISISLANRIAGFSSRGANAGAPDIIKPDIAAPGVQILAAGTDTPNSGTTSGQFISISGTSMASPHVAGVFALLKQAHPDWSPAMARSALMTTARQDLKKTFGEEAADPFDIGAGHIVPNKVFKPGLVYDAGLLDYLAFSCENNDALVDVYTCAELEFAGFDKDASNLNLPSIAIADLTGFQIVKRTVTSVAKGKKTFSVNVDEPEGVEVFVWPSEITLRKGESATYQVAFKTTEEAVMDEWTFGSLSWTYGKKGSVYSPIAIKPVSLFATNSVEATGTEGSEGFDVVFGYDGVFTATVDGLSEGIVSANEIEDAAVNQSDVFIIPEGVSLARFSMFDSEVGDGTGTDDLDIQVYGPDTAGFPLVDSSQGATSEESIDIANPEPGMYIVVVFDFASAEGPTAYNVYNFNLDGRDVGNMSLSAPTEVVGGTVGSVDVSWSDLAPGTRYLGTINYDDGTGTLDKQTEISINTQ